MLLSFRDQIGPGLFRVAWPQIGLLALKGRWKRILRGNVWVKREMWYFCIFKCETWGHVNAYGKKLAKREREKLQEIMGVFDAKEERQKQRQKLSERRKSIWKWLFFLIRAKVLKYTDIYSFFQWIFWICTMCWALSVGNTVVNKVYKLACSCGIYFLVMFKCKW